MTTVALEDFARLEKRVVQLERAAVTNTETIKWMAGTLGTVKATQDEHTRRLDGIDESLDGVTSRLDRMEAEITVIKAEARAKAADDKRFQEGLSAMIAETMREVLKERKG